MAEYTGDVVPLEAPTNPATGKPFGTMVNAAGKANKETADEFGKKNDSWQSWLNNPAGYVAAGGLAAEAARRVIPYLKDRLNPPPLEQIEPTFNVEPPVQPPVQQVNPLDEHRIRKAAAEADLAELKVQQAKSAAAPTTPKAAPTSVVPPPQPVAPTPPVAQPAQPIVPTQAPAAPSFGKGTDMPLNPFTTDIQKIAQVTNPTTAAMAEVATGKPAVPPPTRDKLVGPAPEFIGPVKPPEVTDKFKGLKSEYKSVDQIPAGFEFKPGVHVSNMDNFLHSVMGPEHRLYAKELINSGQMFPEVKGTGFNTEASKLSRAYQGALQSQIPESLSPLKSSFGKLGKAAKVGGVAGTLFALGEAANAAQKGNFGEAAVRGADIATDYIPGVAQIKSGLTPMGLSSTEQEELAYRRRLEEAQKKGAANRGKAYDPRKFYSPMDIGVPPP